MPTDARWATDGPDWEDQEECLVYADWLEDRGRPSCALAVRWLLHSGRWPVARWEDLSSRPERPPIRQPEIAFWRAVRLGRPLALSHYLPRALWHTARHAFSRTETTYYSCQAAAMNAVVHGAGVVPLDHLLSYLPPHEARRDEPHLWPDVRPRLLGRPAAVRDWPPAGYAPAAPVPVGALQAVLLGPPGGLAGRDG